MKPGIVPGARRRALHALLAVASLASPGAAASGALSLSRRSDPGCGTGAPRVGLGPAQRIRPGLQHAAGEERGATRVLRRPPASALERKARHRSLRRGLVRRSGAEP